MKKKSKRLLLLMDRRTLFSKINPFNLPKIFFTKRVIYILPVLSILLLLTFNGCGKAKIDAEGYNLLIITLDTQRADRLGAYGNKEAQTPNLDKLANEGIMFEHCYSPVPLTLPAHCSIFTGKYPLAHHVRDNGTYQLSMESETMAEKMKSKDFHTYAVIGAFVLLGRFGLDQGFDIYDESLDTKKMFNNFESEIPASMVYTKFQEWFEGNHNKRFFAWVHFYDAHAPYSPPQKYREKFEDSLEGRYDGEVAFVDEYVGKIIDDLKRKKVLNNTLVVIVGDHGEAFGEHQEYGHGIFCYEEALKVPLIFYNSRLFSKPLRIKTRVDIVDLMPTLLDFYGIDIPGTIQGTSMMALLSGKENLKPKKLYFESMHGRDERNWAPLMGIIDEGFKYISLPEPELYDLSADPYEKENLFFKKNRMAKEMDNKLRKFVSEYSSVAKDTRRNLTGEDKKHLKTLGYISSFSDKSNPGMDPKKGIVLENEAKRIFRDIGKGKLEEAEKDLKDLITQFPGDSTIIFDLKHRLYSKKGEIDKAIKILEEAIEKFPEDERFIILHAIENMGIGRLDEAEATCKKLIKLNPEFTRAYIILAEIEEKRGNIPAAVKHYEEALKIEPQNVSLKLKYADLLVQEKRYKKALAAYDDCLEHDEVFSDTELIFKIALFHSQFGTLTRSEQLLKKAIAISPNSKFYFSYALVLAKNGKLAEAITAMEMTLNEYRSGLTDKQVGIAQKALSLWKSAMASKPK